MSIYCTGDVLEAHDNLLEVCNEYICSIKKYQKPNPIDATPIESNSDMLTKIFDQPTTSATSANNQETRKNLFSDIDSFLTSDCFGEMPGRSDLDNKDGSYFIFK